MLDRPGGDMDVGLSCACRGLSHSSPIALVRLSLFRAGACAARNTELETELGFHASSSSMLWLLHSSMLWLPHMAYLTYGLSHMACLTRLRVSEEGCMLRMRQTCSSRSML